MSQGGDDSRRIEVSEVYRSKSAFMTFLRKQLTQEKSYPHLKVGTRQVVLRTQRWRRSVYKQAITALSALKASETAASYATTASARGPITAALRWIRQRPRWRPKSREAGNSRYSGASGDEGQALKVVDLLEHAIELGSVDALYTLADISLVRIGIFFRYDWQWTTFLSSLHLDTSPSTHLEHLTNTLNIHS